MFNVTLDNETTIEYNSFNEIDTYDNIIGLHYYSIGLKHLPEQIGNLTNLKFIRCQNNQLVSLPESISKLTNEIAERGKTIGFLSEKLDREKASLSAILRRSYELESYSLPEIILDSRSLSDFFEDAGSFFYI